MIDTPYILDVVTAPTGAVLSVQDMEAFGYFVDPEQFGVMSDAIDAATAVVQGETGRQLLTATYDVSWRRFPGDCGALVLPRLPVASVTSVKYYNTAGALTTLATTSYSTNDGSDDCWAYIIPSFNTSWPATYGHDRDVVVRFVCGYGTAEQVPKRLRTQVAILAHSIFRSREAESCGGTPSKSFVYQTLSQFNTIQEFI